MAISLKDIGKNFFLEYIKYWIAIFIVIVIYVSFKLYYHSFSIDKLNLNIKKAVYVGGGVAINKKYAIVSKSLLNEKCVGKNSKERGEIFVLQDKKIFSAIYYASDNIGNMTLLKLKNYSDEFQYYSYMQLDKSEYKINKIYNVPIAKNEPSEYIYTKGKLVENNSNNFLLTINKIAIRDSMEGYPIFDKNFLLQGIVRKQIKKHYNKMSSKDKLLDSLGIQKQYITSNSNYIKQFLDHFNIAYSLINKNKNIDNNDYNVKLSVINVVCIETY